MADAKIPVHPVQTREMVALEAAQELARAEAKWGAFHTPHEGWAALFEEVDELWDEVRAYQPGGDTTQMRKEAIQVAAMAMRFVRDVCEARRDG